MASKFLHRDDAPFGGAIWEKIDEAVLGAAKGQLSARRLLHVEGPYGYGLKQINGTEQDLGEAEKVQVLGSKVVPLALLRKGFTMPIRDVAAFEASEMALDAGPAALAAVAVAKLENDLIFNGHKGLGAQGLLNTKGVQSSKLKAWTNVGTAMDDLIAAVNKLDAAGFHGPYALALEPERYNLLFRRYEQGNQTEMDHIKQIVSDGVVKAPGIKGGVLIATGRQYATIVLGQDLATAFIGPADGDYELAVVESVALRLVVPETVVALR